MRRAVYLRAVTVLALALAAGACTDDDGAKRIDVGENDPPAQVVADAGAPPATALTSCVDRPPADAPRAPSAGLPCELLPPGFGAPR